MDEEGQHNPFFGVGMGSNPSVLLSPLQIQADQDDKKDDAFAHGFVTRSAHFPCPNDGDVCLGCPRVSQGTYQEWQMRCAEAARRVIKASSDLDATRATPLKNHPACVAATSSKRGALVPHQPQVAVIHTRIEIVDDPFPESLPVTKESMIRAHNFDFKEVVDPANEEPRKGRKKRPAVEFNHTFDIEGGHKLGRHN